MTLSTEDINELKRQLEEVSKPKKANGKDDTGDQATGQATSPLDEWDAGDDTGLPPPRGWLLGNVFCRNFLRSILGAGGTGKTALRYAQYLALATGRPLTGEHVFQRCRVLIISLEDGKEELRRRITAARIHHGITLDEVRG
jgi:RecA-family ATPase